MNALVVHESLLEKVGTLTQIVQFDKDGSQFCEDTEVMRQMFQDSEQGMTSLKSGSVRLLHSSKEV